MKKDGKMSAELSRYATLVASKIGVAVIRGNRELAHSLVDELFDDRPAPEPLAAVAELDLTSRAMDALDKLGAVWLDDLADVDWFAFYRQPRIGIKTMEHLRERFELCGLEDVIPVEIFGEVGVFDDESI